MHAAQALLEGHRALHRCAHHVQPRIAVPAVAGGALDMGPAALQAVQRDAVGGRVEGGGQVGLDAVGDRVHAGGRGQSGRQAQRQFRIADGRPGQQVPRMEAQLAPVVENDDRAARHFAAGARGGRHGDQRRGLFGDFGAAAFDGGIGGQLARVRGEDGDALGQVD
ncbi:hypothetical protein D9M68_602120 [compost metagenome]